MQKLYWQRPGARWWRVRNALLMVNMQLPFYDNAALLLYMYLCTYKLVGPMNCILFLDPLRPRRTPCLAAGEVVDEQDRCRSYRCCYKRTSTPPKVHRVCMKKEKPSRGPLRPACNEITSLVWQNNVDASAGTIRLTSRATSALAPSRKVATSNIGALICRAVMMFEDPMYRFEA